MTQESGGMRIIGSATSPFVRIVRVVCEELGLPYTHQVTAPYAQLSPEEDAAIARYNPLMKVPALEDGGVALIESRVIARYLLAKRPNPVAEQWAASPVEEENVLSVILGTIEAGTLAFSLRLSNPEIGAGGYIARSASRLRGGLAWLDAQPSLGRGFGLPEIALVCGLDWFARRDVAPWREHARLARVYNACVGRRSFQATAIPEAA